MGEYKRVTKKMSRDARNFMDNLVRYLHKKLKKEYRFIHRLVGSTKWNTALLFDNKYDLDYQILLTKRSKKFKINNLDDATEIHKDFKSILDSYFNEKNINGKVDESTSAFTLSFKERNYSFDIVIIKLYPINDEIIRRNNSNGSTNYYQWDELKKHNEAFDKFKRLNSNQKEDLIENHILPLKAREKEKAKKGQDYISSSSIFISEVNNYVK